MIRGSFDLIDACFDLPLKSPPKIVLMAVCRHYPNSFPSRALLAKEAGVCERTVKYALAKREQAGYIKRHLRAYKSTEYEVMVDRIVGNRCLGQKMPLGKEMPPNKQVVTNNLINNNPEQAADIEWVWEEPQPEAKIVPLPAKAALPPTPYPSHREGFPGEPKKRKYKVVNSYFHPGEWEIANTIARGMVCGEDKQPLRFPTQAAAEERLALLGAA